jgi:hypothetical protein
MEAAESFAEIDRDQFTRAPRGRPTNAESDLLRSMVVFSGAGLDSSLKWLVRDALPALVDAGDDNAGEALSKFAERRLASDPARIARLLASREPRREVLDQLIDEQTSGSLQSWQQLQAVAANFGVASAIPSTEAEVRPAFDCRNQIVHELDVNFASRSRSNRRARGRDLTVRFASQLLETASAIVEAVDGLLPDRASGRGSR